MKINIGEYITQWLTYYGIDNRYLELLKDLIVICIIILLSIIVNYIAKFIIKKVIVRIAKKTTTTWDDVFVNKKVFTRLSHLAPAIIIYYFGVVALIKYPFWMNLVLLGSKIYMVIVFMVFISALLNAILEIYNKFDIAKIRPIKGYLQVAKIIFNSIGIILILSFVLNRSPMYFLGGLGAFTAVLMLIFKDTILGFVASIQLSANDMLRPGDWITMNTYGADGDVMEITLTTVKVRNFDNTITTIPTYSLISDSFQNWRGMQESGGRRISRSIQLDINSIKFAETKLLEKLNSHMLIQAHIQKFTEQFSAEHQDFLQHAAEAHTNLSLFRYYAEQFLKSHPMINREMPFIVRLLAPSDKGVPLEIYCFSKEINMLPFHTLQSDIFEHLFAVLPLFELKPFQTTIS